MMKAGTFTLMMYKSCLTALVAAFLLMGIASCKTHERCPAYGSLSEKPAAKG
jgi:hypothetical protein